MSYRPFLERTNKPTEETLVEALGHAYSYYKKIVDLAGAYQQEWNYTDSSGWILKISNREKALLYIIPLKEGYKATLAIRPEERDSLLQDKDMQKAHKQMTDAKKHMEGYALQFDVANTSEYNQLELIIKKLMDLRA